MSRVIFAWGVVMVLIGVTGVLFYGFAGSESPSLFFGTGALIMAVAVAFWLSRPRPDDGLSPRAVADLSLPVPLLALAIVLASLGAELGWWLTLIAAGMAAEAIFALVQEGRAQRAAYRRAMAEHAETEREERPR